MINFPQIALLFLLLLIVTASTVKAEIFVHSVNGKPTLSMDGYFENAPIEVGMLIHPSMNVNVSHLHQFRVHCGEPGEPVNIINTRQISALCQHKHSPTTIRSDGDENYPIIISPRKRTVLALDQIEWGHRNAAKYQLTLRDFGLGGKTHVHEIIKPEDGNSSYNIQHYSLNKSQRSNLKRGQKYIIEITNVTTGESSKSDPGFSGVIQLATKSDASDIENNLKIIKQSLHSDALETYFSAIHLRNQAYYADSTRALSQTITSVDPLHRHYLQVKNAQSEGVPLNYLAKKWMDLLAAAVKKENAATAALACIEIRTAYPDLSTTWREFLNQYKNLASFKHYCNLTDL